MQALKIKEILLWETFSVQPGIIICFLTDCVIINLLQRIFHCEKVETNSNYLKRSILKHTPTRTFTNWSKIMSHRPTLTHTDPQWHTPTQNNVTPIQNNVSHSIRKCQANCGRRLTLEILNDWNCPKMLLCSKAPTTNRMLTNTVWVPGSGRRQRVLRATGTKIVYFHRYLCNFLRVFGHSGI